MLVTLKELLAIAEVENKAIGSFTCPNMEIAMGTIKAAEEMDSPIIIQIAEGRLKHTPLDMIGPLMVQAAKDAKVKIAVHLDHGLTAEKAAEALGYGFTSVMFDGSHYSLQENIDKTNEIAKPVWHAQPALLLKQSSAPSAARKLPSAKRSPSIQMSKRPELLRQMPTLMHLQ